MLSTQHTNLRKQLLLEYHKYLLLFYPNQAINLPEHQKFDHQIKLTGTPRMGPIYILTPLKQKALQEFLKKILDKRTIQPLASSARSPILFVPKHNGK
jgi:hypothetical protein